MHWASKDLAVNHILSRDEKLFLADSKVEVGCIERRAENKAKWKEKVLCTQFLRQTESERNEKTWAWIRRRELKREAEYLIVAAQDQAVRANDIVKSLFLRYSAQQGRETTKFEVLTTTQAHQCESIILYFLL